MYMFKYYSNCQKTHIDSQHFNSILLKIFQDSLRYCRLIPTVFIDKQNHENSGKNQEIFMFFLLLKYRSYLHLYL
jgi:hypothetical protein